MLRLVDAPELDGSACGSVAGCDGVDRRLCEEVEPSSIGAVNVFGLGELWPDDGVLSVELLGTCRSGTDVAVLLLHDCPPVVGRVGTEVPTFRSYCEVPSELVPLMPGPADRLFGRTTVFGCDEKLFGCPAGICWTVFPVRTPPCD